MKVKRDKTLVEIVGFAVVALFLTPALAATAPASEKVFERSLHNESVAARFDVNRQLGRAWVDVELTSTTPSEIPESQVVPQALNGLYYDPVRRQVIYRTGTSGIVCAEDSNFLGTTSLKETGQCQLRVNAETRKVDDGFNGREETVGSVVFEATPLSSAQ